MKKPIVAILAVVLAIALLAGCAGNKGSTGSEDRNKVEDGIKIGINYELSGKVATYGQSSVEGIELAIEEINEAGGINGKKIIPVKYDTKSEPAEATTLATRLITQDKVVMILGPATSGSFKAQIPVAEKNRIPVISGSATDDSVTVDASGVKEYAFRICFTDSYQGTAMASYA